MYMFSMCFLFSTDLLRVFFSLLFSSNANFELNQCWFEKIQIVFSIGWTARSDEVGLDRSIAYKIYCELLQIKTRKFHAYEYLR